VPRLAPPIRAEKRRGAAAGLTGIIAAASFAATGTALQIRRQGGLRPMVWPGSTGGFAAKSIWIEYPKNEPCADLSPRGV
jgi:hypothetical protein